MNQSKDDIEDRSNQNAQNNQKTEKNSNQSKKKKGGNWSSSEEVMLAKAWVHISQQPKYDTNQTGDTFFKRVTKHFNSKSPFEKHNVNLVQIKWASLKTATLKFTAYYAQSKHEPPSGTVKTDWPELAIKLYHELNPKKPPFKYLAAWRVLSTAPKWIVPRPPPGPLAMAIAAIPSSNPPLDSTDTSTTNYRARPSTPPRAIRTKQSKRKHIEDEKAQELQEACNEQLERSNKLAEWRVLALEEGIEVAKQMAKADAEAKASLVQVNDLKVLQMSEDSCQTALAKEVLRMMQQLLKDKSQTPHTSSSSTSTL